jgi:hypothetical protein
MEGAPLMGRKGKRDVGEGEEKERIRVCKEGELSHDPLSYCDTSNQSLTFLCISTFSRLSRKFQSIFMLLLSIAFPQLEFWGPQCPMAP